MLSSPFSHPLSPLTVNARARSGKRHRTFKATPEESNAYTITPYPLIFSIWKTKTQEKGRWGIRYRQWFNARVHSTANPELWVPDLMFILNELVMYVKAETSGQTALTHRLARTSAVRICDNACLQMTWPYNHASSEGISTLFNSIRPSPRYTYNVFLCRLVNITQDTSKWLGFPPETKIKRKQANLIGMEPEFRWKK